MRHKESFRCHFFDNLQQISSSRLITRINSHDDYLFLISFLLTETYPSSSHLRVRLEIPSIDALDQLLGHLDDLLTACWNRQQIIDLRKRRDRRAWSVSIEEKKKKKKIENKTIRTHTDTSYGTTVTCTNLYQLLRPTPKAFLSIRIRNMYV